MDGSKKLILITGASTGLGLALSKKLIALNKYRLVLTARPESMSRFEKQNIFSDEKNVFLRSLDITNKMDRISLINELDTHVGGVDVLINNAGIALRSVVEDASASDRSHILDVNYISPMRLIALVLPNMRQKQSGQIINISSAAGLVGMPTMACYCGSKFALEGATESLWYEVRPWNIKVSTIIPGFINSASYNKTLLTANSARAINSKGLSPYFDHYDNMEKLISFVMRNTFSTEDSISSKIAKVLEMKNPPLRLPVTFDAWLLYLFRRFLPRAIYHSMIFKFLPKSHSWGHLIRKTERL